MIKMTTPTGVNIDLENLRPEDVNIEDIAIGLSNMRSLGGECKYFYSSAQRSTYLSILSGNLDLDNQKAALFGLAHEAYLGGLSLPLLNSKYAEGYRYLKTKIQIAIFKRFGVGSINTFMLDKNTEYLHLWERRDLLKNLSKEENEYVKENLSHLAILFPFSSAKSYQFFLSHYEMLNKGDNNESKQ